MMRDLRETARHYHVGGLALVVVDGKRPRHAAWQTRRARPEELTANVGVILGAASGDLVDVDLDAPEALLLADAVLPGPTLTFGRASKPRSHRLYRAPGARLRQYRADRREMLVELRAQPEGGGGTQTVFPPSTHPSGERIEWDPEDGRDPVELPDAALAVDAGVLEERVALLAVAALVTRHVGELGARRVLAGERWPALPREVLARARGFLGLVEEPPRREARQVADGDVAARARAYLAACPPAISGSGGHAATFLIVQHIVRGFALDDAAALDVLADWNARCEPPWSERELRHKLRQARERGTQVAWGSHVEVSR